MSAGMIWRETERPRETVLDGKQGRVREEMLWKKVREKEKGGRTVRSLAPICKRRIGSRAC